MDLMIETETINDEILDEILKLLNKNKGSIYKYE